MPDYIVTPPIINITTHLRKYDLTDELDRYEGEWKIMLLQGRSYLSLLSFASRQEAEEFIEHELGSLSPFYDTKVFQSLDGAVNFTGDPCLIPVPYKDDA